MMPLLGVLPRVRAFECGMNPVRDAAPNGVDPIESYLFIEGFYQTFELDSQWVASTVQCLAGGYFDPTLSDAIFRDVEALLPIEEDANVMLEYGCHVMGTARVDAQMIG